MIELKIFEKAPVWEHPTSRGWWIDDTTYFEVEPEPCHVCGELTHIHHTEMGLFFHGDCFELWNEARCNDDE